MVEESPQTPPRKGKRFFREMDLDGLHKIWESIPEIRKRALKTGSLLRWTDSKKVGVIGMPSLKLNTKVMIEVIKLWGPKKDTEQDGPGDCVQTRGHGLQLSFPLKSIYPCCKASQPTSIPDR